MSEHNWYQLEIAEALKALGVDPARGLSTREATERLRRNGPNELVERGQTF